MLRLLYYRYKKSGKISTKRGGGLIIRHGHIIRILRYIYNYISMYINIYIYAALYFYKLQ